MKRIVTLLTAIILLATNVFFITACNSQSSTNDGAGRIQALIEEKFEMKAYMQYNQAQSEEPDCYINEKECDVVSDEVVSYSAPQSQSSPTASAASNIPASVTPAPPPPTPTSRAPAPAIVDTSNFEAEVIRLINIQRQSVGSPPLQLYGRLADIARAHSREMASVDQLGHDGLDGSLPWERIARANLSIHPRRNTAALGSRAGNENAGAGQNSPERVVDAWMNSPGHRANMLDRRWTHAGVGFVRTDTGNFRNFWTIKFVRQHAPFQPPADCNGNFGVECYMPGWGMCPPCWRAYGLLD